MTHTLNKIGCLLLCTLMCFGCNGMSKIFRNTKKIVPLFFKQTLLKKSYSIFKQKADLYETVLPYVMSRYLLDDKTGELLHYTQGETQFLQWFAMCKVPEKSVIVDVVKLYLMLMEGPKGLRVDDEKACRIYSLIKDRLYPQLCKQYKEALEKSLTEPWDTKL